MRLQICDSARRDFSFVLALFANFYGFSQSGFQRDDMCLQQLNRMIFASNSGLGFAIGTEASLKSLGKVCREPRYFCEPVIALNAKK